MSVRLPTEADIDKVLIESDIAPYLGDLIERFQVTPGDGLSGR
jgi:hypothetical protein